MKRALIIGIDHYDLNALGTCEEDAHRVANLLERNEDGSKNFDVQLLLSDGEATITRGRMLAALKNLFGAPAELAVLYFAGHGVFDKDTASGILLAQNGEDDQTGIALNEVAALAAKEGITSSVIILDCCQAGAIGDVAGTERALLGPGLTILTATDRIQAAESDMEGGLFTRLMVNGLEGAAADIRGNVTPAAVYAHVDQSLGAFAQRPIYKANVREFVSLRSTAPKIPDEILRQLPIWFPSSEALFALDPSFEPDIKPGCEEDFSPKERARNQPVFAALQLCNRHGLISPVDAEHMYNAAMEHKACRLTALGAHYANLARADRF